MKKLMRTLGVVVMLGVPTQQALSDETGGRVIRIAQLEIDPAQLAAYQAAVREEITESVRLEPSVISIYSVAESDHPNRLHFFEIYADDAAYKSHIASAHFQKYAATTQSMILSKRLIATQPVQLSPVPTPVGK